MSLVQPIAERQRYPFSSIFALLPEIKDLRVDFLDLVGESVEEELQRLGQLGVAASHPAGVKRLSAQPVRLRLKAEINE